MAGTAFFKAPEHMGVLLEVRGLTNPGRPAFSGAAGAQDSPFCPPQEGTVSAPPSTKLVCTIGPVSSDVDTLTQMIRAGMSVSAPAPRAGDGKRSHPRRSPGDHTPRCVDATCRSPASISATATR
jgi:hypothetical protein